MSTQFPFRRALLALTLLAAVCGAGAAHATNCTGTGARTVKLSPCPVAKIIRYQEGGVIPFSATFSGGPLGALFVAVTSTHNDFTRDISGEFFANEASLQAFASANLAPGVHSGTLGLTFCSDKNCAKPLAVVQLPYKIDVFAAPAISKLSPGLVAVGAQPFTLKVLGKFFKTGYKIRLNSTALATKLVSSTELTATVNLASVETGRTYTVKVISTTAGFNSNTATLTLQNPPPVLTSLAPANLFVAAAPFTLTVTGSGFVPTSRIVMDGTGLTTQFVSSTRLTAGLDFSGAPAGTHTFTVTSVAPGGGTSSQLTLQITNATPVITNISPNQSGMSVFPKIVTITGSGFQRNSTIQWNGVNQSTGYISSTQLTVQSPFAALTTASLIPLTVTNPSPGGGVSNTATLEVDAPAPTIAWVSPGRIYTGSGDVTLTVKGGFMNNSYLAWNGTPLTDLIPNSLPIKGQFLQVTIPAADLTTAGAGSLTAVTPGPGGGGIPVTLNIVQHPPQITALSPGFAVPGGTDFTLTLDGVDFDPDAQVFWNGDQLSITQISSSQIQVTVPAAEIASLGVASVTVVNPAASGGASAPATFAVDVSGTAVVALAQPLNDIEWDPTKSVFYGAVPASASSDPHSIVSIDPAAAAVTDSLDTTDEPILLSLAGDETFLYAGFTSVSGGNNSYRRYSLPTFSQDWSQSLPVLNNGHPEYLKALQVSPAFSRLFAFVVGEVGFTTSNTGVSVTLDGFDTWPPAFGSDPWDTIAWSPDGTYLYGGDSETSTASFMTGAYSNGFYPGGGTSGINPVVHNAWSGGRMHVDGASGLVYADNSAAVIAPSTGQTTATLPVSGVMVPDSSLSCAYFIIQTPAQVTAAAGDWTLACYSTADFTTQTRSIVIPAVNGTPTKMMRWGNEGLAFITDGGYIYFVSGQVVTGN